MQPFRTFTIPVHRSPEADPEEVTFRVRADWDLMDKSESDYGIDLHTLLDDPEATERHLTTVQGGRKIAVLVTDMVSAEGDDQLTKHNLTPEQFGYALRGPNLLKAFAAVAGAVADFIPDENRRLEVLETLRLTLSVREAAADVACQKTSQINRQTLHHALTTMTDDEIKSMETMSPDEVLQRLTSVAGPGESADASPSPTAPESTPTPS